MKRVLKRTISLFFIFVFFIVCGCTGNFKPVVPPVNEFPVPEEYSVDEVIVGSFIVEKSFRGNFKDDGLYTMDSSALSDEFKVGTKGFVEYQIDNETVIVEATITLPASYYSSYLVAKHNALTDDRLKYNWPGRFYVVVDQKENCLLVSKNAVYLLDESGAAFVCVEKENGVLVQKEIKVSESNNKYYVVVEGLTEGEKVVLK